MKAYDTFHFTSEIGEEIEVNLKVVAYCRFANFYVGDSTIEFGYKDGIYVSKDGYIVISNGLFIAGFTDDKLITSNNNKLNIFRIIECY
jgi:hypothetical protein